MLFSVDENWKFNTSVFLLLLWLQMTPKTHGVQSFEGPWSMTTVKKSSGGFSKRVQVLKFLKMFQEQCKKNIHIESHMHNDLKTNTFKRRPTCFCWSNEEKTCLSSRTGVRISPKVTISTWRWEGWETQRPFSWNSWLVVETNQFEKYYTFNLYTSFGLFVGVKVKKMKPPLSHEWWIISVSLESLIKPRECNNCINFGSPFLH